MKRSHCHSCRFFNRFEEGEHQGHCLKRAPISAKKMSRRWPIVLEMEWCGAWEISAEAREKVNL